MITYDKQPPINIDIERYVTGCLLLMEQNDIRQYAMSLNANDLCDPTCMRICRAIRQVIRANKDIDLLSVSEYLNNEDQAVLAELMNEIVTTANIETHFKALKEWSARRLSWKYATEFRDAVYDTDNPVPLIADFSNQISDVLTEVELCNKELSLQDAKGVLIKDGISSGFVTHDYNDSGLREECLTLILGSTNHGKTTLARQMLIACAMQQEKSFAFFGESGIHAETRNFSRICASPHEIQSNDNIGGRTIWYPTKSAFEKFSQYYAPYITLIDDTYVGQKEKIFDYVYRKMIKSAEEGAKLFVLDSLTILAEGEGGKLFSHQQQIIKKLNVFKKKYKAHVILVVHPRKGKGYESTSGASEVEKLCDTIIRYIRVTTDEHLVETQNYKSHAKVIANLDLPDADKDKITAMVATEKIREEGTKFTAFYEWDEKRGVVIELSKLAKSLEYQSKGYWVRAVSRFDSPDMPNYDNQIK